MSGRAQTMPWGFGAEAPPESGSESPSSLSPSGQSASESPSSLSPSSLSASSLSAASGSSSENPGPAAPGVRSKTNPRRGPSPRCSASPSPSPSPSPRCSPGPSAGSPRHSGRGRVAANSDAVCQASLDALLKTLERGEGSPYYSYAALVRYLVSGKVHLNGAEAAVLHSVAASLHRRAAGAPIYLAGGRAYTEGGLAKRRPGLKGGCPDVFFESLVHPGIWLETSLRGASGGLTRSASGAGMRYELRAVGREHGPAVLGAVKAMLGLSGALAPR